MGDPANLRGTANRGTAHAITTPPPRPPQDYPPFNVDLLDTFGQTSVPDALAYGLKWQLELDRLEGGAPEPQQQLADRLLALFEYLTAMEAQVERDPNDGALLYRDPIKVFGATRFETQFSEISDGTVIPTGAGTPPPLPAWAPSVWPREWSASERARYPRRPRRVAEIPPFDSNELLRSWLRMRAWQPAPQAPPPPAPAAKSALENAAKRNEPVIVAERPSPKPVEARALDDTLDKVASRYDADGSAGKAHQYSATPLVDDALLQLSRYALVDLVAATGAKVRSPYENDKLIKRTEAILYHSVFTVVLDRAGNPFDLRIDAEHEGLLDYGLLLPSPGSQMRRELPQPGGVIVSVQRAGDGTFRIEDGRISKILVGGVGGLAEFGYGDTSKHALQLSLESFLVNRGASNIASISAQAAFTPEEMTLGRIYLRLYDLVDAATPYVITEIEARARKMIINWQEHVTRILEEAIKQIIIAEVRKRIKGYLIKKIGKRIVPVVNAAFAIYDLASGGQERTRQRYAMACAVLAIKGRTAEDTELAAKVVSKVCADEFEETIIQKIVGHLAEVGKKLIVRKAGEKADASTQKKPAATKAAADDTAASESNKPATDAGNATAGPKGTVAHKQPVQQSAADAEAKRQVNEYVREKLVEAVKAARADKSPDEPAIKPGAKQDVEAIADTGATQASRGKDDPGTAAPIEPAAKKKKPPKPTPEYWPGTGQYGPPTPAQMGQGPQRRRRSPPSPPREPPPEPMHVKDSGEKAPEPGLDVRKQANVRTAATGGTRVLRRAAGKAGGAQALGHESHHVARQAGGRSHGEHVRDLLSQASVSVHEAANQNPARGLQRDSRATFESSSQHWGLHTRENQDALIRELQTVRGDDKATRDILQRHGLGYWEDRRLRELEFWLGPDPADIDPDPDAR